MQPMCPLRTIFKRKQHNSRDDVQIQDKATRIMRVLRAFCQRRQRNAGHEVQIQNKVTPSPSPSSAPNPEQHSRGSSPVPQGQTQKYRNLQDEVQNKATPSPSPSPTPNPNQESRGLSTLTETQKPDGPSETWRVARAGLIRILEATEIVLGASPIPGAKAICTAALWIINGIDTSSSNAQMCEEIKRHVRDICDIIESLSMPGDEDIPQDLKTDVEKLGSELTTLTENLRSSQEGFRSFVTANADEGDLKRLWVSIGNAVKRFQLSRQISTAKGISRLENDMRVDLKRNQDNNLRGLINQLPRAARAAYNSGHTGGPTTCLEGTRVAVLETIKSWIFDRSESRIFWLNGTAGTGKSTIAKTIAEYAHNQCILGGSFFLSRDDKKLSESSLLFPTLAFQLAQFAGVFRSFIGEALQKDVGYGTCDPPTQLDKLIIEPLVRSRLDSREVVLIVIDAFDECATEEEAEKILQLILAHISRIPFIFRVFLTSRSESRIADVFKEYDRNEYIRKYILHNIEKTIVQKDIHLFVEHRLRELSQKFRTRESPPGADIKKLVDNCGELFVYAAISIRFIGNDRVRHPKKQLKDLLAAQTTVDDPNPYAQLDQLYLQCLRSALPDSAPKTLIRRFRLVVWSIVLLRDPLSVNSLSRFIKCYDADEVSDALYYLHSIILTPSSPEEAPRIYHPSFSDFITNPARCSEPKFLVDVPKHEKFLVLQCLDAMRSDTEFKLNILDIGKRVRFRYHFRSKTEIDSLNEVQYSCLHWVSHLCKVAVGDEEVVKVLNDFASEKLSDWIEVMNLSGLTASHEWAVKSKCSDELVKILYDGKLKMLVNQLPRALQAAHNSEHAGRLATCLEGTRVAVLETIKSWIFDPTKSPIFWVNGMAGTGKSTIAKTIAEYAHDYGILGGSFFFSRDDQNLRDSSLVFPTLAVQLAQFQQGVFRSFIGEALQKNADYGTCDLPTQLDKLIIEPLVQSRLNSKQVVLLIIDAFHECASEEETEKMLRSILANISRIPFIFRVFFTSRPESRIANVFNDYKHESYMLHDTNEKIAQSDIRLFVENSLRDLPRRLDVKIKGEWPPVVEMKKLIDNCGSSFAYAAISVRFIGNDRIRDPLKQLEILLGVRPAVDAKPYAQLDQIYLQVLRRALPEDTGEDLILRFHWVVGSIVLLRGPQSLNSLSRFIRYGITQVSDALYHLHSIILPPSSPEEAPRIYHSSFADFITNSCRCFDRRFLVDVPLHEKRLVLRCLDIILHDSLKYATDEHVLAEVQYSCHHWVSHLSKVTFGDEEVMKVLAQFASQKLLQWIDVMKLLNLSGHVTSTMQDAHEWAIKSKCDKELVKILNDGCHQVTSCRTV